MKKFLALLCMITCIFGLTACGSEETLTKYEQTKVDNAKTQAVGNILPLLVSLMGEDSAGLLDVNTMEEVKSFNEYTGEEIEDWVNRVAEMYNTTINVDGYAFYSAVQSFRSAYDSVGNISILDISVNNASARIDGNQIIVEVEVTGEKKPAKAEIVFSNDSFLVMESAALNPESTTGELMKKAALNTLIGMGTVFAVLILISLIIAAFGIIPKIQDNMAKKKSASLAGVDNKAEQIAVREEVTDEVDDLELVAVIAAAIAASEGAASTDGFVVRSIRRRT